MAVIDGLIGVAAMRNAAILCVITMPVALCCGNVRGYDAAEPGGAKFVVYASEENAELRSSLFRVLQGAEKVARIEKAESLAEALASPAEVVVLVLPKQTPPPEPGTLAELKKRKLVGIGFGAAQLFGQLGLEIKGGACAHFTGDLPMLTVSQSTLLGAPPKVASFGVLREGYEFSNKFGPIDCFAMCLPAHEAKELKVDALARWADNLNYAPVVTQGNYMLIGIPLPATQWATPFADLVRAACLKLQEAERQEFPKLDHQVTQPGTYHFELAKLNTVDKPYNRTFYFRFDGPKRVTAVLKQDGSDHVMMFFTGEDENHTNLTRRDGGPGAKLGVIVDIEQRDIDAVGDRYWRLDITNFGASAAACDLTISIDALQVK